MWPRVAEVMIAIWLAFSPFIFVYPVQSSRLLWTISFISAVLIMTFALLSYSHRYSYMHRYTIAVALLLTGFGYFFNGQPVEPALQNMLVTGLILLMLAPLPARCSEPPPEWQAFYSSQIADRKSEKKNHSRSSE